MLNAIVVSPYFLIRLLVRDERGLHRAFHLLLWVGAVESAYGILCFISNHLFQTSVGVQIGQYGAIPGIYGTQYEANLFGSYTACCAIMFLAYFMLSHEPRRAWYGWGFAITLIVSESDGGNGTIQRRDPVTGTLLASHPMLGVMAPLIGGVSAAGAWVSEPTGMLGYIERFAAGSMTPQAGTRVNGSNGLHADVSNGTLWVISEAAGPALNYCADPATGRRRATLPLPDLGQDYLMAVTGGLIYYSVPASSGFAIRAVPVPAACG